jgi:RNA polymerase subunit RPABC4/transcription elongation factor Spt4
VDVTQHLSDQVCSHCGAHLDPGTEVCPQCGASIEDVAYMTHVCANCGTAYNGDHCPQCGSPYTAPVVRAVPETPEVVRTSPSQSKVNWGGIGRIILGFLVAGGILWMLFMLFAPHEATASVNSVSWKSTVSIEEYQFNQHGGWALPSGAVEISRETRQNGTREVYDHTETQCETVQDCHTEHTYVRTDRTCYDDGTCDDEDVYDDEEVCTDREECSPHDIYRTEPTYGTWYTYLIWKWVAINPLVTTGSNNSPYWPEVRLPSSQREAGRSQSYSVLFSFNNKLMTYTPAMEIEFRKYVPGTHWQIKHNAFTVTQVIGPQP